MHDAEFDLKGQTCDGEATTPGYPLEGTGKAGSEPVQTWADSWEAPSGHDTDLEGDPADASSEVRAEPADHDTLPPVPAFFLKNNSSF